MQEYADNEAVITSGSQQELQKSKKKKEFKSDNEGCPQNSYIEVEVSKYK